LTAVASRAPGPDLDWLNSLARLAEAGEPAVLVTVASARGSTPREAGTRMVVSEKFFFGTIGGGHLEFRCLGIARAILKDKPAGRLRRFEVFPLGPALGQCCGGAAEVLFEAVVAEDLPALVSGGLSETPAVLVTPLKAEDGAMYWRGLRPGEQSEAVPRIVREGGFEALSETLGDSRSELLLFGAGHVGQAVVVALAPLPFRITWIDSRADIFPTCLPVNVRIENAAAPKVEVEYASPGAFGLVMTHSHQLDLEICESVLRRGDFVWLGLIGSATKRVRFERRLLARGISADQLQGLTCPIGLSGITGKHPAEIAASVAAQLLVERERQAITAGAHRSGRLDMREKSVAEKDRALAHR
jgi:xanthine dehydrogenase accessory factor